MPKWYWQKAGDEPGRRRYRVRKCSRCGASEMGGERAVKGGSYSECLLTEGELSDLQSLPLEGRLRFRTLLRLVAEGAREQVELRGEAAPGPYPTPRDLSHEGTRHHDAPRG